MPVELRVTVSLPAVGRCIQSVSAGRTERIGSRAAVGCFLIVRLRDIAICGSVLRCIRAP